MSFFTNLDWRHATKAFEPERKVSAEDLKKILHAIRLAPTSYGLQPFRVVVIEDPKVRETLSPHAYHQKQITTSTALLVFVARTDIKARIDQYFEAVTGGDAGTRAKMQAYEGMMRGALEGLSTEAARAWSAKQAYIALGFGLAACAEFKIDSCPMEGFNGAEFDRVLGVRSGEFSVALMAVGHRDPAVPPKDKFRFSDADLFERRR